MRVHALTNHFSAAFTSTSDNSSIRVFMSIVSPSPLFSIPTAQTKRRRRETKRRTNVHIIRKHQSSSALLSNLSISATINAAAFISLRRFVDGLYTQPLGCNSLFPVAYAAAAHVSCPSTNVSSCLYDHPLSICRFRSVIISFIIFSLISAHLFHLNPPLVRKCPKHTMSNRSSFPRMAIKTIFVLITKLDDYRCGFVYIIRRYNHLSVLTHSFTSLSSNFHVPSAFLRAINSYIAEAISS